MNFPSATRPLAALPLAWAAATTALTLEGDTDAVTTGQIVVKLRLDGASTTPAARVAALAAGIGAPLVYRRTMAIGALVVNVPGAPDAAAVVMCARA